MSWTLTPKEYVKHDLILVFQEIHVNHIDLRKRPEILDRLDSVINKMDDSHWKEMSRKSIIFIKDFTPKYAGGMAKPLDGIPPWATSPRFIEGLKRIQEAKQKSDPGKEKP